MVFEYHAVKEILYSQAINSKKSKHALSNNIFFIKMFNIEVS